MEFLLLILLLAAGCNNPVHNKQSGIQAEMSALACDLENSLFEYITGPWYPACIDTVHGGYISSFDHDWKMSEGDQSKALVQQARHLWTTAYLFDRYPQNDEFLGYAEHGFNFIRDHFQDEAYGGLYYACSRDGSVDSTTLDGKRIYGQAFAIHGLARYHKVSGNSDALDLAIQVFKWMNEGPHDSIYGGYFEILNRDGTPATHDTSLQADQGDSPLAGLKEFNSSLHILEAFTELYHEWPNQLLRKRLEEMYFLFRDTFIHDDGYLQLYFYPDWTLVPTGSMKQLSKGNAWFTHHITYGHDVETAYLITEAAHALGYENDKVMMRRAKALVDHSLSTGWDREKGGFYYIGYKDDAGNTTIHDNHKAFWVESEGLNAIALMHSLYPNDDMDYFSKLKLQWNYIDNYLIDKEYGGWYNYGLDTYPENRLNKKSHNWKTTYHNVRGMVSSINLLSKK